MQDNHLITQLLYDWNSFHLIYIGVSVGLESNFFRLKAFHISKICAKLTIDMFSGVFKRFSGKQWKLKKSYLSMLRGS